MIQQAKERLRLKMRQMRAYHTQQEMLTTSLAIRERLLADDVIKKAHTIAAYASLPDEVNTEMLIDILFEQGKKILLPVVEGNNMYWRAYDGKQDMKRGVFSIMEPRNGEVVALDDCTKPIVVIVPGMAFDALGHRLGRGKGYYDRTLFKIRQKNIILIGICYPWQMVGSVPTEGHDIMMNKVICN